MTASRYEPGDIRSYRYAIQTPTGRVGSWPWKRTHEFLVAVFMAADAQFYDEAQQSADEALRDAVRRAGLQPLRGRSRDQLPLWAIERYGESLPRPERRMEMRTHE